MIDKKRKRRIINFLIEFVTVAFLLTMGTLSTINTLVLLQ